MQHPPKISFGQDAHSVCGYDLFAQQDIKTFEVLTTYAGVLETEHKEGEDPYLSGHVNGKQIRNLGPLINDGFPNCSSLRVQHTGFDPTIIIAIRDIKAGKKLFWNYGKHHTVKIQVPHLELNPTELEHYVQTDLEEDFENYLLFCSQKTESLS